jgi:hypothetical protein
MGISEWFPSQVSGLIWEGRVKVGKQVLISLPEILDKDR